mmetsp:Transcript_7694/g.17976  ORF Transcript_7694/g.17976 Transcript_7694/m.17976 type:complete len:211 (-) Transcript_7694:151-783(-)
MVSSRVLAGGSAGSLSRDHRLQSRTRYTWRSMWRTSRRELRAASASRSRRLRLRIREDSPSPASDVRRFPSPSSRTSVHAVAPSAASHAWDAAGWSGSSPAGAIGLGPWVGLFPGRATRAGGRGLGPSHYRAGCARFFEAEPRRRVRRGLFFRRVSSAVAVPSYRATYSWMSAVPSPPRALRRLALPLSRPRMRRPSGGPMADCPTRGVG